MNQATFLPDFVTTEPTRPVEEDDGVIVFEDTGVEVTSANFAELGFTYDDYVDADAKRSAQLSGPDRPTGAAGHGRPVRQLHEHRERSRHDSGRRARLLLPAAASRPEGATRTSCMANTSGNASQTARRVPSPIPNPDERSRHLQDRPAQRSVESRLVSASTPHRRRVSRPAPVARPGGRGVRRHRAVRAAPAARRRRGRACIHPLRDAFLLWCATAPASSPRTRSTARPGRIASRATHRDAREEPRRVREHRGHAATRGCRTTRRARCRSRTPAGDNIRVTATYPYQSMLVPVLPKFGFQGGGSSTFTFNMQIAITMRAIS